MVCVTRHMGIKSTLDDLMKLEAVYVQPRMAGRNTKGWVTGTFKNGRRPSLRTVLVCVQVIVVGS